MFALVQLFLLLLGLPTTAYQMRSLAESNISSKTVRNPILWLPPQWLRTQLIPLKDEALLHPSNLPVNFTLLREGLVHATQNPSSLVPEFSAGQCFWFVVGVVPWLSFSMLDRRVERNRPLREPPVKRGKWLTKCKMVRVCLTTAARLVPSILICVLSVVSLIYWAPGFQLCANLDGRICRWISLAGDAEEVSNSTQFNSTLPPCPTSNADNYSSSVGLIVVSRPNLTEVNRTFLILLSSV
ncbi:unnamed protein product [Echinostoma caproni]|uniref:G_PROTEIN_RECEP_F1_2 domain-containing protein n=1 Tax=Echinostoma caproni TaxID=27848 RepID=A0A3P8LDD1_9TREM|nr:unnamed protein product [Echinostoma caproni]